MLVLEVLKRSVEHIPPLMYQGDVAAEFLYALHAVGGEYYGAPLAVEPQHFVANQLRINGVKAREGLVEDHEFWLVKYGGNELHLLSHSLRQVADLFIPPTLKFPALKPRVQALFCVG